MIRTDLMRLSRQLLSDGLVVRTWGNFSLRQSDSTFIITPSGRHYETMQEADAAEVHLDGTWTGPFKPSSEHPMHAIVYDIFDSAGCVIHTHQPYASALSLSPRDIMLSEADATRLGQAMLPVATYALPSTHKLHVNVGKKLAETRTQILLLASHGALIWAETADEARRLANELEDVATRLYRDRVGVMPEVRLPALSSVRTGHLISYLGDQGQPVVPDEATRINHEKIYRTRPDVSAIQTCIDPEVLAFCGSTLKPYLDDFAQIAGVKADSSTKHGVVLAPNIAYCLGADMAGAHDVHLVLKKNARAARFAQVCDARPIAAWECLLMNIIYTKKYSKQAD